MFCIKTMLLEKFSRDISFLLTDKQYIEEDWIKIVYTRVTVYRLAIGTDMFI